MCPFWKNKDEESSSYSFDSNFFILARDVDIRCLGKGGHKSNESAIRLLEEMKRIDTVFTNHPDNPDIVGEYEPVGVVYHFKRAFSKKEEEAKMAQKAKDDEVPKEAEHAKPVDTSTGP